MDIKDILNTLGLDFSDPETRRGAIEAIDAILASRAPVNDGGSSSGSSTTEVEIDPDLVQPSIKQAQPEIDDDIDIEDEEDILSQIKHNESEDQIDNTNSSGDTSSDNDKSSTDTDTSDTSTETDTDGANETEYDEIESDSASDELETDVETEETSDDVEDSESATEKADDTDGDDTNVESELETQDEESDGSESEDGSEEPADEGEEVESGDESDVDFDEDDLVDDELKNSAEDEEIKTKHNARKIKRERTIAAAKKALTDAQAKKVSPALIRELEKALEALEALTEAITKNLQDISDEEFNTMINRVFDAIQACGDSDLTFTSEDERAAQVKNIKDDLADASTQAELSAEDLAKIRAETQAIKAREKETTQYQRRSAGSFKGFQEFLNSLYRAIALQVHTEEAQDDSWSAISRRNSGAGVLQQGKKINELSNKKIPVIDFYFDQSGSWTASDIKIGEKAIQSLADMEAEGKIKINIYYFANTVHTDAESARNEGGTSGWNEIVKNIITTQATNVIIMTDDDMEGWWRPQEQPALKYTVPGYVWYLWKNGSNAPRLPRDLKGRGGVQQFSFSRNDL
jgi:hypothetical protein